MVIILISWLNNILKEITWQLKVEMIKITPEINLGISNDEACPPVAIAEATILIPYHPSQIVVTHLNIGQPIFLWMTAAWLTDRLPV